MSLLSLAKHYVVFSLIYMGINNTSRRDVKNVVRGGENSWVRSVEDSGQRTHCPCTWKGTGRGESFLWKNRLVFLDRVGDGSDECRGKSDLRGLEAALQKPMYISCQERE